MICGGFARRSAPAPLAVASDCPLHPYRPDAGGGVFHGIVSGPLPRFFLLFSVRPAAFFLAVRAPWAVGFLSFCWWAWFVWRSGLVSLLACRRRFCYRLLAVAGVVWFYCHSSMKYGRLSIILAYLQIFS